MGPERGRLASRGHWRQGAGHQGTLQPWAGAGEVGRGVAGGAGKIWTWLAPQTQGSPFQIQGSSWRYGQRLCCLTPHQEPCPTGEQQSWGSRPWQQEKEGAPGSITSGQFCRFRKNMKKWSFRGGSDGKESTCQCRGPGFDPWVRKIPWRRAWQPTPVFLPGESHGQRSLVGNHRWGCEESDTTQRLNKNNCGKPHKHPQQWASFDAAPNPWEQPSGGRSEPAGRGGVHRDGRLTAVGSHPPADSSGTRVGPVSAPNHLVALNKPLPLPRPREMWVGGAGDPEG